MKKTIITIITVLYMSGLTGSALAARLIIDISEGTFGTTPIAVIPFVWSGTQDSPPEDIAAIIDANLARSGRFSTLARRDMLSRPTSTIAVNFRNWKLLKIDHLLIGKISATGSDEFLVQVQLLDVLREKQLVGVSYPVHRSGMRRLAHQISDMVYEKITGEAGAFNTRIAYVASSGSKKPVYYLYVADSDGFNAQSVLKSRQPVMSPAWSPDGKYLAYVSFEGRRSQVYVQEVATGARRKISGRKGINGAPAWSPDGRRLALTLSYRGNPDIFIYAMQSKKLRQLTFDSAIDTEASWSPDGGHILFTSDRGGKPQLYKIPVPGGQAERITFEGEYNARGVYSPDGKTIAMVHGQDRRYRIALMDVATGRFKVITRGFLDESPSFAPNGRILLYATADGNTSVLSAVSVDGRSHQRLMSQAGDIREPAWSPYNR